MSLKLFVWEGVLTDYTSGVMFALAENEEEAKALVLEKAGDYDCVREDLREVPLVYTSGCGFAIWGGG